MSHASSTGSPARRRWRIAALLTVWVACLAGAGAAQAAITTSNITAPADGSVLFDNEVASPTGTFTVSGTSDGGSGDAVDIDCYRAGREIAHYLGPANAGVPVAAGGAFSAAVPLSALSGESCELLALPHGTAPNQPTAFTGPRVAFTEYYTSAVSGGPNAGALYDFGFFDATLAGLDGVDSVGECGPQQLPYDGTSAVGGGPFLLYCAGSLYTSKSVFSPTGFDLTRSGILVDGQNAYDAWGANQLNTGSPTPSDTNVGFPALTVSLDSYNTSTGNAQTTESENLVKCSPNDVFDPSETECTSFVSTGVRFQRVTDFTGDGTVATELDTYTTTDGASHTLDLEYETDLGATTAGWELPGQTSFAAHSTGDTGAAPTSTPGTIYAIFNTAGSPSLANPVAAMTFATPYNSIRFDNTLWAAYSPPEVSALIDYQRTVPAGGSVTIQWSYATGTTLAAVAADADAFSPPTISISSPASGGTLTSSPVTVTGTTTAASGIKSVTVNGVRATVSGSSFSAPVPLALGANQLTATVTSISGATKTASESVTYTGPAPVVATDGPTRIGSSTAKVSGTLTPGATAASYYFQYGKATTYGHQTAAVSVGAGTSALSVSAALRGLTSHSNYHYRLVATNAGGTSYGTDRTFKTLYALRGLSIKVSRRGTHSYHVTGALRLPKGVSTARGCRGSVTISAKKAGSRRAKVTKRCTYSATVSAHLKGHGQLTFTATFGGNSLIGSFTSRGG